jgi:hypothetical protein
MTLKLPNWLSAKANGYAWYNPCIACFAFLTAKHTVAVRIPIASGLSAAVFCKFLSFLHFIYHLPAANSGPG